MTVMAVEKWQDVMASHSAIPLAWGPTDVDRYLGDPKRIAFFMSRYKFAAKMLHGCRNIVDVGCGSGMGTLALLSDTGAERVLGVDFDSRLLDHAVHYLLPALQKTRPDDVEKLSFACRDFIGGQVYATEVCDGIVSMDVIEHIDPEESQSFVDRLAGSLRSGGVCVVGTPNKYAEEFGSVHSRIGHINLLTADDLRAQMSRVFRRVFLFSMNDEIVHTGEDRFARYLIAVGVK